MNYTREVNKARWCSVPLIANLWVLSIMPNRRPETESSGNAQGKLNEIFQTNQANQEECLLPFLFLYWIPYIRVSHLSVKRNRVINCFVKSKMVNFGSNIPTKISGPPLEMIPNIPVERNRNGPFHFTSNCNFWNLWRNGMHRLVFHLSLTVTEYWLNDWLTLTMEYKLWKCAKNLTVERVIGRKILAINVIVWLLVHDHVGELFLA